MRWWDHMTKLFYLCYKIFTIVCWLSQIKFSVRRQAVGNWSSIGGIWLFDWSICLFLLVRCLLCFSQIHNCSMSSNAPFWVPNHSLLDVLSLWMFGLLCNSELGEHCRSLSHTCVAPSKEYWFHCVFFCWTFIKESDLNRERPVRFFIFCAESFEVSVMLQRIWDYARRV